MAGNVGQCKALIGDGHRVMATLEGLMNFQGLDQYAIQMSPYPGATIKCSKVFGMRLIEIATGGESSVTSETRGIKCLCLPHFSIGIIKKEKPEGVLSDVFTRVGRYLYDVDVCLGKGYVRVDDVLSAGWEKYCEGQLVMVSIGAPLPIDSEYPPYDCGRDCLMQQPQFPVLVVAPLHVQGSMKKWLRMLTTETVVYGNH